MIFDQEIYYLQKRDDIVAVFQGTEGREGRFKVVHGVAGHEEFEIIGLDGSNDGE